MTPERAKHSVERNADYEDSWDATCGICGFVSTRHETKAAATQRLSEHTAEHEEASE